MRETEGVVVLLSLRVFSAYSRGYLEARGVRYTNHDLLASPRSMLIIFTSLTFYDFAIWYAPTQMLPARRPASVASFPGNLQPLVLRSSAKAQKSSSSFILRGQFLSLVFGSLIEFASQEITLNSCLLLLESMEVQRRTLVSVDEEICIGGSSLAGRIVGA